MSTPTSSGEIRPEELLSVVALPDWDSIPFSFTSAEQLFLEQLPVIERAISFVCRRHDLRGPDADDFASTVKVKLIDHDYAVIRSFAGRSSFRTFITIVIQRLYLDDRIHHLGKWHPSAEAKRLGETAIALERLLHRDGRTIEEATAILGVSRPILDDLAARLPARKPKRRETGLEAIEREVAVPPDDVEEGIIERDRQSICCRTSEAVRKSLREVEANDRLILQLRFEAELSVAQISRVLHLDQKMLYRRIERALKTLRASLERQGIAASDVEGLFERSTVLDFGLRQR